ncbi:MAG: outer membrane beta-barrel protein [Mariprofundaceae bacterium]|nr:outer membrane beta-barrel protein [Mariprofundaceae bacterium]
MGTWMVFSTRVIAVLLLSLSYVAQAQSAAYVGLGLGSMTLNTGLEQTNVFHAYAKGGAKLNDYLAFEVRLGSSAGVDQPNFAVQVPSPRLEWCFSVLAKPMYAMSEELHVYALLGLSSLKTSYGNVAALKRTKTNVDLSYGLGADFLFNQHFSFAFEWVQYSRKQDALSLNTAAFKGLGVRGMNASMSYAF